MSMVLSLSTGLLVGIIFGLLSLPIPAPEKAEGILGIIGIFLGYLIIKYIKKI